MTRFDQFQPTGQLQPPVAAPEAPCRVTEASRLRAASAGGGGPYPSPNPRAISRGHRLAGWEIVLMNILMMMMMMMMMMMIMIMMIMIAIII